MSTSLILLFTTLATTCFFIGRKTSQLRSGKLNINFEERPWRLKYEIKKIYTILSFIGKRIFKILIFNIGKLYVTIEHKIAKFLRTKFPKYFKEKEFNGQKPSFFISTMQEYKLRMRRHKKMIEEKTKDQEEVEVD